MRHNRGNDAAADGSSAGDGCCCKRASGPGAAAGSLARNRNGAAAPGRKVSRKFHRRRFPATARQAGKSGPGLRRLDAAVFPPWLARSG